MMRRSKGFRGPRRRGFDDDVYEASPREFRSTPDMRGPRPPRSFGDAPRAAAPADGPVVDARVKWFNADKGFGFAELADGAGDAFLHIGALQAAGHETVPPGAKLRVQVGQGAKGPQITRVLEVDDSTAKEPAPRGPSHGGARAPRHAPDLSTAVEMTGTVKWFNSGKGFGFVASVDGGKDVFIHASVLGEAGLATLAEGQAVSMRVVDTPKGREAVSIALAD